MVNKPHKVKAIYHWYLEDEDNKEGTYVIRVLERDWGDWGDCHGVESAREIGRAFLCSSCAKELLGGEDKLYSLLLRWEW